MFLVYLGVIIVIFGYTTALATEQYPETWESSVVIWSSLFLGLIIEFLLLYWWVKYDRVEIPIGYHSMGEWFIYDDEGRVGFLSEDLASVAVIYSYNCWIIVVAGWSL